MGAGGAGLRAVEVERQKHAGGRAGCVGRIGLIEGGALIGESADAAIAAEVVIERAIFLDEDDDVIDIGDFGARSVCSGIGGGARVTAASWEEGAPSGRQLQWQLQFSADHGA
jgi:hypothetical protein